MTRTQRHRVDLRRSLFRPAPVGGARERAAALAVLVLAGCVLVALSLASSRDAPLGVLLALPLLGAAIAAALLRSGDRLPMLAFHPLLALGSLSVALLAWSTGPGTTPVAYALLLVWVALYAGYFFSLAGAAVHGLFAVACYAAVLVWHDLPLEAELFLLVGVGAVVAGVAHFLSSARALSEIDPLTGTVNRRGLARYLEDQMARAATSRAPLSIALVDVDDFRRVNQTDGPGAADELLVTLACRFSAALPPGSTLSRYGGDEFVVVLPGYGLTRAREVVEGVRGTTPEGVSCSAGVAAWAPGDSQSMLVSRADMALYTAKHGGRGRTAVMGDDPDAASELWGALDNGEIELRYQPIYDLESGDIMAFEALVRWAHPTRGLLDPHRFIPAAEHSGAIHALGRWVVRQACEQVVAWREELPGSQDLGISINLSTAQLSHPDLVTDLRDVLEHTGLPPHALTIELTEGAFEGDLDRVTQLLGELKRLGIRLAMDDFGTGHSSLARLRGLPFDVLKIDRSFVSPTYDVDTGDGPLLPAIVAVARSLGLETVAEGIEDVHQLAFVTEHGCTCGQGYLLGRPAPAHRAEARLRAGWRLPQDWNAGTR